MRCTVYLYTVYCQEVNYFLLCTRFVHFWIPPHSWISVHVTLETDRSDRLFQSSCPFFFVHIGCRVLVEANFACEHVKCVFQHILQSMISPRKKNNHNLYSCICLRFGCFFFVFWMCVHFSKCSGCKQRHFYRNYSSSRCSNCDYQRTKSSHLVPLWEHFSS